MEEIQNTIDTFDRLRKYQYKITVENGIEIVLKFSRERYHHLAGFQHLTDLDDVANPRSKQEFYNKLKNGNISIGRIKKSCQYDAIRERIESFGMIEEILAPGEGKIIVEFDSSKTESLIRAKFHLYRREGDPLRARQLSSHCSLTVRTAANIIPLHMLWSTPICMCVGRPCMTVILNGS